MNLRSVLLQTNRSRYSANMRISHPITTFRRNRGSSVRGYSRTVSQLLASQPAPLPAVVAISRSSAVSRDRHRPVPSVNLRHGSGMAYGSSSTSSCTSWSRTIWSTSSATATRMWSAPRATRNGAQSASASRTRRRKLPAPIHTSTWPLIWWRSWPSRADKLSFAICLCLLFPFQFHLAMFGLALTIRRD